MKTILSIICLVSCTTILHAQKAGILDKSFGDTGVVTEQSFSGSCYSLLLQNDGKLVTTGSGEYDKISGFSAYRLLSDGSTDLSFGDSGRVVTDIAKYSGGLFGALQMDGKIVETGQILTANNRSIVTSVRYKNNGSLDSSFGTNGNIQYDLGSNFQRPTAILIQSNGKIVVTGLMEDRDWNGNPIDTIFIIRYNSNGSIDGSFGNNGVYKEYISDPFETAGAVLQTDGKILIGGDYELTKSDAFFVRRYTSNGKPDSTFGVNGEADYRFPDLMTSEASALLNLCVQADGKILAAGHIASPFIPVAILVRFSNNGTVDSSFGISGMVQTTVIANQLNEFNAVAVQSDNKIVAAGSVYNSRGDTSQYTVTRFLSNGKLDSTFGTNGTTITNVGQDAYASSIVIQSNGKIVVGGSVFDPTPPYYFVALARYNNDGSKRQIIISKIKHYIHNHNNLESNATADVKATTLNISLAPNPVNNVLTINNLSVSTKYDVRITNGNGNTIVNKQVSNIASCQINVQALSAGVYYINIISNDSQSTTLKFIKQ